MTGVSATGASVLPTHVIADAFRHQYDRTMNIGDFRHAIAKLDSWYADRGIFGQVLYTLDAHFVLSMSYNFMARSSENPI